MAAKTEVATYLYATYTCISMYIQQKAYAHMHTRQPYSESSGGLLL